MITATTPAPGAKLDRHGVKKVVPDESTLKVAYRRAMEIAIVQQQIGELAGTAHRQAQEAEIPKTLERIVRKRLQDDPSLPWDQVVADLAAEEL